MITVHTLANTAAILLHQHIADEMGSSYSKCIRAANACMLTIKSLSQADFEMLDPIVGVRCPFVARGPVLIHFPNRAAGL